MSEDKQQRANLLIDLATRLQEEPGLSIDAHPDETGSRSIDGVRLNAAELEELKRIQKALFFLDDTGIRSTQDTPDAKPQSEIDSVKANSDGTLPDQETAETGLVSNDAIGRFKIIKLVGRGGFSDVYKAFDPTLNRDVALKVLKNSNSLNEDAVVRFQREAQAAGILNHPNIVPVFEQGVFENQMFIVSELCEGDTLKSWFEVQQKQAQATTAATIVKILAEAVEHAHQKGVIHRDMKPANIMMGSCSTAARSETSGITNDLRITDFGLAKHSGKTDLMETTEGAVVGTPAYMSPEQASGSNQVGGRSDIYSLGVILYELLTGRVPILRSTHIDTLIAINQIEIKNPRQLNPSLPLDLDSICMKCLQKDATDRYASALDLSMDLDRWLNGEVVAARPTTKLERLSKWCQRNPVAACSIAFITAALLFATWQWRNSNFNLHRATSQTRVAESEKNRAESETARAEKYLASMTGFVDKFLEEISSLDDLSLVTDSQRDQLNEVLSMQRSLIDSDQARKSVKTNTLKTYSRMSGIQKGLGLFQQSAATSAEARKWLGEPTAFRDSIDELDGDFIHLILELGLNECRAQQQINEAKAAIESATWCESVYEEFHPLLDELTRRQFAVTLPMFRGLSLAVDGQIPEATKAYQAAEIAGEELLLFDDPPSLDSVLPVSSNLINLGQSFKLAGDFDNADRCFRKSIDLIESNDNQQNVRLRSNLVNACSSLFTILLRMGELDEATATSKKALQLIRSLVDEVPTSKDFQHKLAAGLLNHGNLMSRLGAHDDAFAAFDEIVEMKERGLEVSLRGKVIVIGALNQKFEALVKLNNKKQAESTATEAVNRAEEYFKVTQDYAAGIQSTAQAWTNLMKITTMRGKRKKVLEMIPKGCVALEKMEKNSIGSASRRWARTHRIFYVGLKSKQLAELGRLEKAVESVGPILELESWDRPKPRATYIEAAKAMSIVLNHWSSDLAEPAPESRENAHDKAIAWLEMAISDAGFRDRKRLLTHMHFRSLREHPRFNEVVALIPAD